MSTPRPSRLVWRYVRGLAPPLALLSLLVGVLIYLLQAPVADELYDQEALEQWVGEARFAQKPLPELVEDYRKALAAGDGPAARAAASGIDNHLLTLGEMTRLHQNHLPLFPVIYRLEVTLNDPPPGARTFVWDSRLARRAPSADEARFSKERIIPLYGRDKTPIATLRLDGQLHAYDKWQQTEARERRRRQWLSALAVASALVGGAWIYFFLRREREREVQRLVAQQQIQQAEKLLLENELRRQEEERKREEVERELLLEQFRLQEAEQKNLALKAEIFANIGVMAGSYAHNIKNLLVRPNDLIRRCLAADGIEGEPKRLLEEVQDTLSTVTDRVQQILKTVRRDPTHLQMTRLDLNDLAAEVQRSWADLAEQKWRLTLTVERAPEPLPVAGDDSLLLQAVENLLFNARDATFEMRNHIREQAHDNPLLGAEEKRRALIAAAAWKGTVVVRTSRRDGWAVLEVTDNGIGMTEEVRRRCCEPHFSTKRGDAQAAGHAAGMGLGLSFVQAIVERHQGRMEIVSAPREGATFRILLPLAQ